MFFTTPPAVSPVVRCTSRYIYATQIVVTDSYRTRYDVYDADGYTPCRYNLLKRGAAGNPADAPAAAAEPLPGAELLGTAGSIIGGSSTSSTASSGSSSQEVVPPVVLPGTEGRWRLPVDASGLEGLAGMLTRARAMYTNYVAYYLIQVLSRGGGQGGRVSWQERGCMHEST